jgi:hypothetical protein
LKQVKCGLPVTNCNTASQHTGSCRLLFRFYFFQHNSPQWGKASSFTGFLDHTKRHTIVGRTSLDEGSARRRDLYLKTHNTHNRQPFPQWDSNHNFSRRASYALYRAIIGTGSFVFNALYLNTLVSLRFLILCIVVG